MENKLKDKETELTGLFGENKMTQARRQHLKRSSGFSLFEILIVLAIAGVLCAISIPMMISQRRLIRSAGVTREMMAQLRYTRQLAMSERKAFTFSYDDQTKQVTVYDHNNLRTDPNSGKAVLSLAGYPNTAGSTVVSTFFLGQEGLTGGDIIYGIPSSLPSTAKGALTDGVTKTTLINNKLNITFQRDGSVIDATGTASDRNPQDQGLFIYNSQAPASTASAISVLGASGRVKIWRYNNVDKYVE